MEEVRGSTSGSDGDSTEHGGETRESLSHRLPQPRDVRQNPEHGRYRSPQTRGTYYSSLVHLNNYHCVEFMSKWYREQNRLITTFMIK